MAVRILVDGAGAVELAEDLVASAGVVGHVEALPQEADNKDLAALTAVATIIGAAGGVMAIVDSVLGWRDRLTKSRRPLPRIVIVVGEQRRTLSSLRREELADLIESDPDTAEPVT